MPHPGGYLGHAPSVMGVWTYYGLVDRSRTDEDRRKSD